MTRSPKKAIRIILKAANIVLVVFLCVILFFSLYTAIARLAFRRICPKVLGFSAAIVVTPSMSGTIEVNDMVIIQEKTAYSEGDIITYEKGGKYITHRMKWGPKAICLSQRATIMTLPTGLLSTSRRLWAKWYLLSPK